MNMKEIETPARRADMDGTESNLQGIAGFLARVAGDERQSANLVALPGEYALLDINLHPSSRIDAGSTLEICSSASMQH
jgi:hypothetical protein